MSAPARPMGPAPVPTLATFAGGRWVDVVGVVGVVAGIEFGAGARFGDWSLEEGALVVELDADNLDSDSLCDVEAEREGIDGGGNGNSYMQLNSGSLAGIKYCAATS